METFEAPDPDDSVESPESDDSFEHAYAYMKVLAMSRLTEAVNAQKATPGQRYFVIDHIPGKPRPFALITLAESEALYGQGEAELIEVSLPIVEADIARPTVTDAPDQDCVIVERHRQRDMELTQPVEVTARNYADLFYGQDPPIEDLEQKLLTYQLMPLGSARQ